MALVLIVDDSPTEQHVISAALEKHGFETVVASDGEEAIATGIIPLLAEKDRVVATYREHGQALARGIPMGSVLAEMYGKAEGCAGGRGGSMHLFDAATNFYGGNAIVGGGLPLATGLALSARVSISRDLLMSQFWQNLQARLQPAVPKDITLEPG